MKQPKSPCLDCTPETGRSAEPNCHMTCKPYLAFRKECDVLMQARAKTAREYDDQRYIEQRRIKMASEGKFYKAKYYSRKKGE